MNQCQALTNLTAEVERGELTFPTAAAVTLRICNRLNDPDCHPDLAARLIQAEPLLAARTVAVANSVTFNRSGRAVADTRNALVRLGFGTVRALATALVARQMAGMQDKPLQRYLAKQLWEHTSHVAALAQVIARRVTKQDPEIALFAGMIHEIGGFYLLSRSGRFPDLLRVRPDEWTAEGGNESQPTQSPETVIGRAVLRALSVPAPVLTAIEVLWAGYVSYPPATLGDTLLLADLLSPVPSPLMREEDRNPEETALSIDLAIGQETLSSILKESEEEVQSLTNALKF